MNAGFWFMNWVDRITTLAAGKHHYDDKIHFSKSICEFWLIFPSSTLSASMTVRHHSFRSWKIKMSPRSAFWREIIVSVAVLAPLSQHTVQFDIQYAQMTLQFFAISAFQVTLFIRMLFWHKLSWARSSEAHTH